jgi:hypothetical protein
MREDILKAPYYLVVGACVLFLALALTVRIFPDATETGMRLLGTSVVFVSIAVTRKLLQ